MTGVDLKQTGQETAPPPPAQQVWNLLTDSLAALGTAMIGFLMVIICADIVARNLLGSSLPLVSELSAITLVMIVFLQLGTAVRNGRLARIEFVADWLNTVSPRLSTAVNALWNMTGTAICGAIAWSTWGILMRDFSLSEFIGVTGVSTLPVWPFRALILLGAGVAAVQFALLAVRDLCATVKPHPIVRSHTL